MSVLRGLLWILLFQCLGGFIKSISGIFLPGAVIGMLLLFCCLCIRARYQPLNEGRSVPETLNKASQQLIALLPLLFMPAAAGIFFLDERFNQQWLAISIAVFVGTVLSLIVNAVVMRYLINNYAETRQDHV